MAVALRESGSPATLPARTHTCDVPVPRAFPGGSHFVRTPKGLSTAYVRGGDAPGAEALLCTGSHVAAPLLAAGLWLSPLQLPHSSGVGLGPWQMAAATAIGKTILLPFWELTLAFLTPTFDWKSEDVDLSNCLPDHTRTLNTSSLSPPPHPNAVVTASCFSGFYVEAPSALIAACTIDN